MILLIISGILICTMAHPIHPQTEEYPESSTTNVISARSLNELYNQRLEVKNGINLKGMYSYRDGAFRRTIRYVADDKGYRVIGEEVTPVESPIFSFSIPEIPEIEPVAIIRTSNEQIQTTTEEQPRSTTEN